MLGCRSLVARACPGAHDGPVRAPSPDLTPEQQEVLADVAEQGVHVVHVPRDGGQGPSYSYTIGMWESFQQPEVVVFGMPEDVGRPAQPCSRLLRGTLASRNSI